MSLCIGAIGWGLTGWLGFFFEQPAWAHDIYKNQSTAPAPIYWIGSTPGYGVCRFQRDFRLGAAVATQALDSSRSPNNYTTRRAVSCACVIVRELSPPRV